MGGSIRDAWLGSLWFRPGDLRARARIQDVTALFLPYLAYDCSVSSKWSGRRGVDLGPDPDDDSADAETRIRWSKQHGVETGEHKDRLLPAASPEDQALFAPIEPFTVKGAEPFDPDRLGGRAVLEYARTVDQGWKDRAEEIREIERGICEEALDGDASEDLVVDTRFTAVAARRILVPVYLVAYTYRGKPWRFIVNGYSGKFAGTAPWSVTKVGLFWIVVVSILGAPLVWLAARTIGPLFLVLVAVIGMAIGWLATEKTGLFP